MLKGSSGITEHETLCHTVTMCADYFLDLCNRSITLRSRFGSFILSCKSMILRQASILPFNSSLLNSFWSGGMLDRLSISQNSRLEFPSQLQSGTALLTNVNCNYPTALPILDPAAREYSLPEITGTPPICCGVQVRLNLSKSTSSTHTKQWGCDEKQQW